MKQLMENYCMYVWNTEVSLPRPSKLSVAKEKRQQLVKNEFTSKI